MAEKNQGVEQTRLALGGAPETAKGTYKPFALGPNPELGKFIAQNAKPYDVKTDLYDVKAFMDDLVVDKHNKLYTMHMYWSKKDPECIEDYIKHYTRKGDLVLDPFSGSGTTGCAATMTGRNIVLVDPSPAACFIAAHYCTIAPEGAVEDAYNALLNEGRGEEVDKLFKSKCHRCGGEALVEFIIWSDAYQCPKCAEVVSLFECPKVEVENANSDSTRKQYVCPLCLSKNRGVARPEFVVSTRTKRFKPIPVACKYACLGKCKPKLDKRTIRDKSAKNQKCFEEDSALSLQSCGGTIAAGFKWPFPKGYRYERDALEKRKIETLGDLFTARNRRALSILLGAPAPVPGGIDPLIFLTWILLKTSLLMGCGNDGVARINVGTYYIAPIRIEPRPTKYLKQALSQIRQHFAHKDRLFPAGANVLLSNESALDALETVSKDCIDYMFTDPPYNYKVQYGELNFPWEAVLGYPSDWTAKEIIENPSQRKTFDDWASDVRKVLANCFRVLKPGRWLSLCYHDTDPHTWTVVQDILMDCGFSIESVNALEPKSKSRNAITAEIVVKSDLVINCRKPRSGEALAEGDGGEVGHVSRRVRDILIETCSAHGGQTREKLWDVVLKRLLTRGQMAEHRFGEILGEVATRAESGRWFVKEEFEALSEGDLRNEEDAGRSLERFARFRCMGVPVAMAAQLSLQKAVADNALEDEVVRHINREMLGGEPGSDFKLSGRMKGCEFYDCLFFYLTRYLKGRAAGRTPRRNLAEFLEEYLVRFRDGDKWLYRPPTGTEVASLKKSRQSGLGRRVRQFVAYLNGEGDFPRERIPDTKSLVAWLKHCANFGLAEAGVALFEKGGLMGQLSQLGEDERYDVEDYYAQCRRNAGRKHVEEEDEQEAGEE